MKLKSCGVVMAIIVNLVGTPGAGKSTGCAYIFSKLKMAGVNAELVTEFAKDKVWENNNSALDDQLYIFAKQHYKINRCADKVDVIITDSPLLLSILYNRNQVYGEELNKLISKVYNSYKNMTYLITRVKKYNPAGRIQTEKEADKLKEPLVDLLNQYNCKFSEKTGEISSYDEIVAEILAELKNN